MKKFKFRFQTILDIRTRELEKAELKVAEAQSKVLNAKQTLKNLQNEFKQTQINLKKIITVRDEINVNSVTNHQNYLKSLDRRIHKQYGVIKEAEENLDIIRKEMLIIRQKKLMMDKIKEKDLANYKRELEVQDIKMIDEISTGKFGRN